MYHADHGNKNYTLTMSQGWVAKDVIAMISTRMSLKVDYGVWVTKESFYIPEVK